MASVGWLSRWKQFIELCMCHKSRCYNTLNKLRNKTEIRYRSVGVYVVSIKCWFFLPWKNNSLLLKIREFCREILHSALKIGARTPAARFTIHVGAGSSAQCFAGMRDSKRVISSALTRVKLESGVMCRLSITGGGAVDVVARIWSIFEVKWFRNYSAEKFEIFCDGSDSILRSFDHSAPESSPQDWIVINQ